MAIYYVSNLGSDSNDGLSTGTPWQTISKVNSTNFNAGDQILFKKGDTFYGALTANRAGASGNPIIYDAYGTGANPIITGFVDVTSWDNLGSNIWRSTNAVSTLTSCNMITIGGTNTAMGRFPKVTDTNKGYYTFQSSSGYTSLTSTDLTGNPNWTGAEVVIRSQAFHLKRSTVTSQSGSTINFNSIGESMNNGNGFFFQNDIRCCTQQNDWFYDSSSKKISIYSTSQPSNIKVSAIENLVTITANYITFQNISFTGANGCAFYNNIFGTVYNNIIVQNCTFSNIGVTGFYTNLNYLSVLTNTFTQCNTTAIECTYGGHNVITENTISNIGLFQGMRNNKTYTMCNSCVDCGNVTGYTVTSNYIYNVGFNGISCWASSDVIIQNNFVDTFCSVLDDGGGIYLFAASGSSFTNGLITQNVCVNGIAAIEGSTFVHHAHGIYLDQGTGNIEVSYNHVGNVAGAGLYVTSAGNNNIHHNTSYNGSEACMMYQYFGGSAPIPTGDQINNNIFVAKYNGIGSLDEQKALYIYFSDGSKVLPAFSADYNYYTRPYADDKVVFVSAAYPNWTKTLAEWQTYSSKDTHSQKSVQAVTTVNDIQWEYNGTSIPKNVTLTQGMIDVSGTKYIGTITLQPYTSLVLLKDYSPAQTLKYVMNGLQRVVDGNGNAVVLIS